MNILIVYDSYFGNTEELAKGIGEVVAGKGEVRVVKADHLVPADAADIDYIIVGSPTRGFQATQPIKSAINRLPQMRGVKALGFDTRVDANQEGVPGFLKVMMKWFGYGIKTIQKMLRKKEVQLLDLQGFYVNDKEGPLVAGELARAKEWALQYVNERET